MKSKSIGIQMTKEISLPKLVIQVVVGFIIYGALFFIPAGTIEWIEAWAFLIISFSYVLVVIAWFWKHDPTILQSRSKINPERGFDTIFLLLSGLSFLAMFLIPAIQVNDQIPFPRVLSPFPPIIKVLGFGGIILAFWIIFLVMKENSYASKTIRVQEGQKVIDTGPYAMVRHPMYFGFIVMCMSYPFAFGSLVTIVPSIFIVFFMSLRIIYEERTLIEELDGYKKYMEKVQYRLIPKLW
jgi:protein-S-isoprenylcysteine O-methyltransferase Ste14